MKVLSAILQYQLYKAVMESPGRKLLIALTCGQAFDSWQALDGWKGLMKKEGENTGYACYTFIIRSTHSSQLRVDYLIGFLDPLVVRSIAELIPSTIISTFTIATHRHGRATPEAFVEAIDSIFLSERILSKNPLVHATGTNFFRYATSVVNRAPWSLPVPFCGVCGPTSQVVMSRRYSENLVRYKCRCCHAKVELAQPKEGVEEKRNHFWRITMESYLGWCQGLKEVEWTSKTSTTPHTSATPETAPTAHPSAPPETSPTPQTSLPPIREPQTWRQYFEQYLPGTCEYLQQGIYCIPWPQLSLHQRRRTSRKF